LEIEFQDHHESRPISISHRKKHVTAWMKLAPPAPMCSANSPIACSGTHSCKSQLVLPTFPQKSSRHLSELGPRWTKCASICVASICAPAFLGAVGSSGAVTVFVDYRKLGEGLVASAAMHIREDYQRNLWRWTHKKGSSMEFCNLVALHLPRQEPSFRDFQKLLRPQELSTSRGHPSSL